MARVTAGLTGHVSRATLVHGATDPALSLQFFGWYMSTRLSENSLRGAHTDVT